MGITKSFDMLDGLSYHRISGYKVMEDEQYIEVYWKIYTSLLSRKNGDPEQAKASSVIQGLDYNLTVNNMNPLNENPKKLLYNKTHEAGQGLLLVKGYGELDIHDGTPELDEE